MKKVITMLILAFLILCNSAVYATIDFKAKLTTEHQGNLTAGTEFDVVLTLDNFTENEQGINVLLATLNYDKSVFEEITSEDITAIQNWDFPTFNQENGKLLIDSYAFINTPHNAIKIKVKVKDKIDADTKAEIKLTEIVASDGESDIEVEDAVAILQIEKSEITGTEEQGASDNKLVIMAIAIIAVLIVGSIVIVFVKRKKSDI